MPNFNGGLTEPQLETVCQVEFFLFAIGKFHDVHTYKYKRLAINKADA